jgi:hypothetical protein
LEYLGKMENLNKKVREMRNLEKIRKKQTCIRNIVWLGVLTDIITLKNNFSAKNLIFDDKIWITALNMEK